MFESSPSRTPQAIAPAAIPSLTDVALDTLPFGVICLDREGTIVRYNLAEARLARLDRSQVLGKSFFRRVAPCTATPEFEGRVRAFFNSDAPLDRFPYLFDFKFGAQQVDVELIRAPQPDRVYLLVNRRQVSAPREGLPPGFAAPLQAELAPREAETGVLRGELAQRVLTLDQSVLSALHQTCQKMAPQAWPLFTREWGWQWGRHAVVDLEAALLEDRNQTLRELPMRETMERVSQWAFGRGLGLLRFDFALASKGVFAVTLERSAVGEAAGAAGASRCQLMEGLLEAVCEHLAQRLLTVREVRCCAQGASACLFIVAADSRRAPVEKAIAGGAQTVEAVLEAVHA